MQGLRYVLRRTKCRPRDGKNSPLSPLLHHPYRPHRCTPLELALAYHRDNWRKLRLMPAKSMLNTQSISLSGPISAGCRLAGRSHSALAKSRHTDGPNHGRITIVIGSLADFSHLYHSTDSSDWQPPPRAPPVSDRPGLSVAASLPVYLWRPLSTAKQPSVAVTPDSKQVHSGCFLKVVNAPALLGCSGCLPCSEVQHYVWTRPATPRQFLN